MKVLAQSYDWLLFLTDEGLAKFIKDLLLSSSDEYKAVQDAFISSYTSTGGSRTVNSFTKKFMGQAAHAALDSYFSKNNDKIEKWFNVISPNNGTLQDLKCILKTLKNKDWETIL